MKKAGVVNILLCLVLWIVLSGCQSNRYRVHVDIEHASQCKTESGYKCGDEVTIKLEAITEHYYKVFVDGVEVLQNDEKSNMVYTYYTFIMPNHDVDLIIEDHYVDIPLAPQ